MHRLIVPAGDVIVSVAVCGGIDDNPDGNGGPRVATVGLTFTTHLGAVLAVGGTGHAGVCTSAGGVSGTSSGGQLLYLSGSATVNGDTVLKSLCISWNVYP